jgi:hypothetical protein
VAAWRGARREPIEPHGVRHTLLLLLGFLGGRVARLSVSGGQRLVRAVFGVDVLIVAHEIALQVASGGVAYTIERCSHHAL